MWREFPVFFRDREPGIIKWNIALTKVGILPADASINLVVIGNNYDPMQKSTIIDFYEDSLSFHTEIINSLGNSKTKIIEEIQSCEQIAKAVGDLAKEVAKAGSSTEDKIVKRVSESAKERFYFCIDQPFRQWLSKLDPEEDVDEAVLDWRKQAKEIARQVGQALVEEAGPTALVGRSETVKKKTYFHAAPKAYNQFLQELKKIYGEKGGRKT